MGKKSNNRPTDTELEILGVFWKCGTSSVRNIHNELCKIKDTGYSTTLKMIQVMFAKGLLVRDESTRPQLYKPARSQKRTQKQLENDLVMRAFDGAAGRLAVQALSSQRVSSEDLAKLRKLIDEREAENDK